MEADHGDILFRQDLFCTTLKKYFRAKVTKYQNILMKNGVHLYNPSMENLDKIDRSQSIDEHLELILGSKSVSPSAYKSLWKIGNRISIVRVFRWIYDMVRRTKSSRILQHLDGIPECELQSTLETVGQEIATAYEYQLFLLAGDEEVVSLAQHAVLCMLASLNNQDAQFRSEELIQAVLEVKPQSSHNQDIIKTRPVICNGKQVCLRWRLGQIFKQPGLRIMSVTQDACTQKAPERPLSTHGESKNILSDNCQTLNSTQPEETALKVDSICFDLENVDECSGLKENLEIGKNGAVKVRRTIWSIEMDYENDFMKVTDHYCEVPDFSPLETYAPLCCDEGVSKAVEEDLSTDIKDVGLNLDETDHVGLDKYTDKSFDYVHNDNLPCEIHVCKQDASNEGAISTLDIHIRGNMCNDINSDNLVMSAQSECLSDKISATEMPLDFSKTTDTDLQSPSFSIIKEQCLKVGTSSDTHRNGITEHGFTNDLVKLANPQYKFYGCFTPYGAKCRPQVYGFRGPLHVWNEEEQKYTLIYNDSVTIATRHKREVVIDPTNCHQSYTPKTACEH